jgi:hypothetical protein
MHGQVAPQRGPLVEVLATNLTQVLELTSVETHVFLPVGVLCEAFVTIGAGKGFLPIV